MAFEAETDYLKNCFEEYNVTTDPSGRYMALTRKWHLIGLELAVSVACVGIRSEPTGVARHFNADVVAVSKRALKAGEILDGEGGYTVAGGLRPAETSIQQGWLPLGLAHGVRLKRDIEEGEIVRSADVELDPSSSAVKLRGGIEASLRAKVA